MHLRPTLLLLALVSLAACSSQQDPAATGTTATPAATTPTAPATPATGNAPAAAEASAPAAIDPADAAIVEAANQAARSGPALVAGVDYVVIENGQPLQPLNGKIEVVEVFGYVCPACDSFQPLVNAWKATLADDVRFSYVPAPFGPAWMPYAKAFYVAQSKGLVERSHDAIFHAIHDTGELPGEGKQPDAAAVADFYARYGADPGQFLAAMDSFSTNASLNRGKQFMVNGGINATPTLVVNGKYRVKGKSFPDMLRIASQLIEMERAATP